MLEATGLKREAKRHCEMHMKATAKTYKKMTPTPGERTWRAWENRIQDACAVPVTILDQDLAAVTWYKAARALRDALDAKTPQRRNYIATIDLNSHIDVTEHIHDTPAGANDKWAAHWKRSQREQIAKYLREH